MEHEHEYELAQIATDPFNTLQPTEYAYYFCRTCLFTVKRRVSVGLETPKDKEKI